MSYFYEAKEKDLLFLEKALSLYKLPSENITSDTYLNYLIKKPWGYEYRIYADNLYDAWKLSIDPGGSTSMHCHPKKDTALLCLKGSGITHFINGEVVNLQEGDKIYIKRGVFHSTSAGEHGIHLIEIENPRDKFDLIRLEDNYGRKNQGYETDASADIEISDLVQHQDYMLRDKDASDSFLFVVGHAENRRNLLKNGYRVLFSVVIDVQQHILGGIHVLEEWEMCAMRFPDKKCLFIASKF
ncbi:cupin domain-containing protein [Affinibrenneria salicis]|uniref:Cupin domain-containing protein n=1 Tax=Affinibrenneria salicis TaxID=2590031 RepID=A0A5J5FZA0_9GAMM|nr:cupin domain-containing protein [Affinibrenneria salicis]KAA8999353.1 cupin domain-containing protein [Affinibrenneria salicis]